MKGMLSLPVILVSVGLLANLTAVVMSPDPLTITLAGVGVILFIVVVLIQVYLRRLKREREVDLAKLERMPIAEPNGRWEHR